MKGTDKQLFVGRSHFVIEFKLLGYQPSFIVKNIKGQKQCH